MLCLWMDTSSMTTLSMPSKGAQQQAHEEFQAPGIILLVGAFSPKVYDLRMVEYEGSYAPKMLLLPLQTKRHLVAYLKVRSKYRHCKSRVTLG